MKILISADLEGVSGVVHPDQVYGDSPFYRETLMRWTQELNAIVSGLREAGVEYIVINDSHNHMRNLNPAMVPNAMVVSGWQRAFSMIHGVDQGFDGCFFTGYHGMAGAKSTLSHTYRPRIVKQVYLNRILAGETTLNASMAGFYNVPVALISGDEGACLEAQKALGDQIVAVQTKRELSRYSALSYPFEVTLRNLKAGAIKAIKEKEKWKVYKVTSPTTISVVFAESNHADACELIPNVKRVGDTQVEYTAQLYPTVFKCFLAMCALAVSRDDVVT